MKPKQNPREKPINSGTTYAENVTRQLFTRAKAQFGDAVKSFWFYDGDLCPGCLEREIDAMKYKGKDALAINAFIYRARGVLIGYFLCGICATEIFREAEKNPGQQTPLHSIIEDNLKAAYRKHLSRLNA